MSSRMRWVALLLLGLAVPAGDRAAVAGEFDGTWVGRIGCSRHPGPLEARVDNHRFTATLGRGPAAVVGIIRADHSLNLYWEGDKYLYGKFRGERFEGGGEFSHGKCRFRLVREGEPEPAFLAAYDGAWHLEEVTGCLAEERIQGVIHVRGDELNGIAIGLVTYEFTGIVGPDGGFEGRSSAYTISGRFDPDEAHAEVAYRKPDGTCTGTAVLARKWPATAEQLSALPKPPQAADTAPGQVVADLQPSDIEPPDVPAAPPAVDEPPPPDQELPPIPQIAPLPPPLTPTSITPGEPPPTEFAAELARLRYVYYRGEISDTEYAEQMIKIFEQYNMPLPPGTYPILEQPPIFVAPRPGTKFDLGQYFALVIGNNNYSYIRDLETAVHDAEVVADILRRDYGFEVTLLMNATRAEVIDELDRLRDTLKESDNLLIYYAGHGWLDARADQGYWLPADAEINRRRNWISNADITDTLRALRAKHAIVVADSCYSGSLTRGAVAATGMRSAEDYFVRIAKLRSRQVLTSGAIEPVTDSGGGGHSVFARAFIEQLKANETMIDGAALAYRVKEWVLANAKQTPIYEVIPETRHDPGGDFIFVRHEFALSLKSGMK